MLLEKPPDVCAVHLFAIHTWTPKVSTILKMPTKYFVVSHQNETPAGIQSLFDSKMVEFWLCRLNVDGSIIKRFQEERIKGRHLHRLVNKKIHQEKT